MQLEYEEGFDETVVKALKNEGHEVVEVNLENGFYAVNAISIDSKTRNVLAFADPRRRGGGFFRRLK